MNLKMERLSPGRIKTEQKKVETGRGVCQVCGDVASGTHYRLDQTLHFLIFHKLDFVHLIVIIYSRPTVKRIIGQSVDV